MQRRCSRPSDSAAVSNQWCHKQLSNIAAISHQMVLRLAIRWCRSRPSTVLNSHRIVLRSIQPPRSTFGARHVCRCVQAMCVEMCTQRTNIYIDDSLLSSWAVWPEYSAPCSSGVSIAQRVVSHENAAKKLACLCGPEWFKGIDP